MNVLIINGHPAMETSNANKAILEEVKRLLPEVEVSELQALYPTVPALLKKWVDDVFAFGFAYGTAYRLEGKKLLLSFTTGAPEGAYQKCPISNFFYPHRQTANFTKMEFLDPIVSYAMHYEPNVMPQESLLVVQQKAKDHAARLVAQINKIS